MTAFFIGLAIGITLTVAGIVYLNVKRPAVIDSVQGFIRKL